MKTNSNEKINEEVYFMDIRYTEGEYIPEGTQNKRTYRYIIDGDGKEKLCVYEEKDNDNENE